MHKKLIYNGKSSADMGLVIQAPPAYSVPERDAEKTHIPGRNGDIITDNGCYKNVVREYSLAKGYTNGPVKTTVDNGQELYEWLTSAKGRYVRLEDDYDPDVYRLATYISSGSLTDIFDKAFAFGAKFECKPQRYLKIGEIPISYGEGETTVIINNLSHYESKPEIKIKNIPAGIDAVTLMSVKNSNEKEVSLVTLKGDREKLTTLIIDSEEEECLDEDGNNSSDRVSLNGKNFPILENGNTKIDIKQYDREDYEIPSYDTIIQQKQSICESSYSPRETTIASFEEKYTVRPFDNLIKEREISFEASSYYTRLTEICDNGLSINDLDYASSTTIQTPNNYTNGTIVELEPTTFDEYSAEFNRYGLNDFLEIAKNDDGRYSIVVKEGAVCYVKDDNKKLIKYETVKGAALKTVIINMSTENNTVEKEILPDIKSSIQNDLPTFISCEIFHKSSSQEITSISYKFNFEEYSKLGTYEALYWKDKVGITGLLGKSGWSVCQNGDNIVNYSWSSLKKKFVPNGNTFASDTGYKMRFVLFNGQSKQKLQYDFGEETSNIFNVVLYVKRNKDDKVENIYINIYGDRVGYYKITPDNSSRGWRHVTSDPESSFIGQTSLDKSFKIEYLKDLPKYSNETDWPSWLNSKPVFYNKDGVIVNPESGSYDDADILNADHMRIKVNLSTYYRYYQKINEIETSKIDDFYPLEEGKELKKEPGDDEELNIKFNEDATIGKYWGPNEAWKSPYDIHDFEFDRANSTNKSTPSGELPSWLRLEVSMQIKLNSDPSNQYLAKPNFNNNETDKFEWTIIKEGEESIYTHEHWYADLNEKIYNDDGDEIGYVVEAPSILFYSGDTKGGFYKYDNSISWVYHDKAESDSPIIKIGYQDTVLFYYIENMPNGFEDYKDEHGETPEWVDNFEIIRKPGGNENPLSIEFKIKNSKDGYYKANSQVNWTNYNVGEVCLESLINETNTISHLKERTDQSSLENASIIVTPKWWML